MLIEDSTKTGDLWAICRESKFFSSRRRVIFRSHELERSAYGWETHAPPGTTTFKLDGFGPSITLGLSRQLNRGIERSQFGLFRFVGDISMGDALVGKCVLKNSNMDAEPMVRLDLNDPVLSLSAFRKRRDLVSSPLVVRGLDGVEIELGGYGLIDKLSHMPDGLEKFRPGFVGFCRVKPEAKPQFTNRLQWIAMIVLVVEGVAERFFMAIDP